MRYLCLYNPDRDIQPCAPSLSIDISKAIETGVVFDTGTVGDMNDIDDPSNIWGRVSDSLHAAELQKNILHGNYDRQGKPGRSNGNGNGNGNGKAAANAAASE